MILCRFGDQIIEGVLYINITVDYALAEAIDVTSYNSKSRWLTRPMFAKAQTRIVLVGNIVVPSFAELPPFDTLACREDLGELLKFADCHLQSHGIERGLVQLHFTTPTVPEPLKNIVSGRREIHMGNPNIAYQHKAG